MGPNEQRLTVVNNGRSWKVHQLDEWLSSLATVRTLATKVAGTRAGLQGEAADAFAGTVDKDVAQQIARLDPERIVAEVQQTIDDANSAVQSAQEKAQNLPGSQLDPVIAGAIGVAQTAMGVTIPVLGVTMQVFGFDAVQQINDMLAANREAEAEKILKEYDRDVSNAVQRVRAATAPFAEVKLPTMEQWTGTPSGGNGTNGITGAGSGGSGSGSSPAAPNRPTAPSTPAPNVDKPIGTGPQVRGIVGGSGGSGGSEAWGAVVPTGPDIVKVPGKSGGKDPEITEPGPWNNPPTTAKPGVGTTPPGQGTPTSSGPDYSGGSDTLEHRTTVDNNMGHGGVLGGAGLLGGALGGAGLAGAGAYAASKALGGAGQAAAGAGAAGLGGLQPLPNTPVAATIQRPTGVGLAGSGAGAGSGGLAGTSGGAGRGALVGSGATGGHGASGRSGMMAGGAPGAAGAADKKRHAAGLGLIAPKIEDDGAPSLHSSAALGGSRRDLQRPDGGAQDL